MFEFKKTGQQQKQRFRLRAWVGGIFALACFGVLVGRFWSLQVDRYEGLSERADRNRIAVVPIPPRRGEILDRNGEVLARNYRTYTLEVVPAHAGNVNELFDRLTEVVYISPTDQRRFKRRAAESSRYASLQLRNNLNETEAAWFAAHAFQFPGVELRARWVREYPQGLSAAHVVGYIGRIAEGDIEELDRAGLLGNYRGTDVIGKKGIEKTWEEQLHGRTGLEEVEVTAGGRPMRTLRRIDPVPGSDIMLSIDLGLQKVAEEAFEGQRGALVALDPDTGEVLAFVSQPSFDPNLFVDGIDVDNWRMLNDSPDHPLINRPLYGTYPIGSTYKPFVGLAALELGKRRATDRISDPGYFEFGGQKFRNAGGAALRHDRHALRPSWCRPDTYFYSLGPEIGVNALHDFAQAVRLRPDHRHRPGRREARRAAVHRLEAFGLQGQGAPALVCGRDDFRGGRAGLQRLHAAATGAGHVHPGQQRPLPAPAPRACGARSAQRRGQAHRIRAGLPHSAQAGQRRRDQERHGRTWCARARRGALRQHQPYQAAGKTGTAQVFSLRGGHYRASAIDERLRDHALFMGFAPLEHPRIAVALIVENAGWGASVAAPVARKVFDYWLAKDRQDKIVRPERADPLASVETIASEVVRKP